MFQVTYDAATYLADKKFDKERTWLETNLLSRYPTNITIVLDTLINEDQSITLVLKMDTHLSGPNFILLKKELISLMESNGFNEFLKELTILNFL